ncbi:MAG: methyltransferase domain-containing protein [Planctomycetaceae bacterium]
MPYSNRWNRFIYACWSPFYDFLIGLPPFQKARSRLWQSVAVNDGQRLLLVGVGTGEDFRHLPDRAVVLGIDLSLPMLAVAARKKTQLQFEVTLVQADAQLLPVTDNSIDVVVMTLILSVVPDPHGCLREAVRVVRPEGRILILDKFADSGQSTTPVRRLLNLITRPFGTDINRRLDDIRTGLPVRIIEDIPAAFGNAYRNIVLQRDP